MRRLTTIAANWPFALKFAIPALVAVFLIGVIEYASLSSLNELKSNLHDVVERRYNASVMLEQSVDRLRAVNGEVYLLQLKKAAAMNQDIGGETKRLRASLDQTTRILLQFRKEYASPQDMPRIDSVLENIRQYSKAVDFVGSMLDIDFKATVNFIVPLRDAYENMIGNLSDISSTFLRISRQDLWQANERAEERAHFIFLFDFVAFILTLLIMVPLAYSTMESIKSLATATVQLADGDTQIDLESLARRDELGRLVSALTVFRDNIDRMAELKKVSLLYASMNAMLDSLQQGLFTFGPDGICSDTYSRACLDLLQQVPAGKTIGDVLRLPKDKQEQLTDLYKFIFGPPKTMATSPEIILDMLPRYYQRPGEEPHEGSEFPISLEYTPIFNASGKVQSVLVIATDHSREIEAARLDRERQNKVMMILRVLSTRNAFIRFFNSISDLFATPAHLLDHAAIDQVRRELHTLKGTAGIYYLYNLASALHEVESALPTVKSPHTYKDPLLQQACADVRAAVERSKPDLVEILGEDFDRLGIVRTLPLDNLKLFASNLSERKSIVDIRHDFIRSLMGEPIHRLLSNNVAEIRELADRYGKNVAIGEIEGEDYPVMTETYAPLFASLTHISRNIMKYAVEEPEIRQKYGKPETCQVTIRTEKFQASGNDWFRLIFTDDGGGIDPEKIKNLLLSRGNAGVKGESDEEIIQHIFDGGLSTSSDVTELAGRGVGLSAVRLETEKIGGTVRVASRLHEFTRITIELPFIWTI